MWHVRGTGKLHTVSWWGNLRDGDSLVDLDLDGEIILKWILKWDRDPWTGLMIGIGDGRF
jgi:hypothetical protein